MKLYRTNRPHPQPLSRPTGEGGAPATGEGDSAGRNPYRTRVRRRAAGFTLIELLLVLVILGVLAAIVVPKFSGRTEQARITAATTQIATFGTALDGFEVDNGYYPRGSDGLQELVEAPRDAKNWKGPYLQVKGGLPLDPWGNAYVYESPGKNHSTGYDLMSMGPDGRAGSEDDITNWSQAGASKSR